MVDEVQKNIQLQHARGNLGFYRSILQQISFAPRDQGESLEDTWGTLKELLSALVEIIRYAATDEVAKALIEYGRQFIEVSDKIAKQARYNKDRLNYYVNATAQCKTWLTILSSATVDSGYMQQLKLLSTEANFALAKAYYQDFQYLPKNMQLKLLNTAAQTACEELFNICRDDSQFCDLRPKLKLYLAWYFKTAQEKNQGTVFEKFITTWLNQLKETTQLRLFLHAIRSSYYTQIHRPELAKDEQAKIKKANAELIRQCDRDIKDLCKTGLYDEAIAYLNKKISTKYSIRSQLDTRLVSVQQLKQQAKPTPCLSV